MELTSVYRLKALTIGRELYKLRMPVTDAEKTIVRNRAAEVAALRELLKPQVRRIVETHYTKDDADVFGPLPLRRGRGPVPGLSRRKG